MSKRMVSFRISPIHEDLLEEMVKVLDQQGIKTNKTVVLEKAITFFASEKVLPEAVFHEIRDKHFNEMLGKF